MMEAIVVGVIVAAASVVAGRHLFREVAGAKPKCGGCGDDCPLANACACAPDAARSAEAPENCPMTSPTPR